MTGITRLEVGAGATSMFAQGGTIEYRLDAPDGELFATQNLPTTLTPQMEPSLVDVKPTTGKHDLYVLFKAADPSDGKSVGAMVYIKVLKDAVK